MLANKNLPNIISALRIAGTVWLLFMKPLSTLFLVVYVLTGASDVADGAIARKYGTTSELMAAKKAKSKKKIVLIVLLSIIVFHRCIRI